MPQQPKGMASAASSFSDGDGDYLLRTQDPVGFLNKVRYTGRFPVCPVWKYYVKKKTKILQPS